MSDKRFLIFIFSIWLAISLHLPAWSQAESGLDLAIAAQQLYAQGELTSAADMWQRSAEAFAAEKNPLGTTKSSINKAQVLQDLGLYPKACDTLLEVFEVQNPDCTSEQIDNLIRDVKLESNLSITQGIGLRSLGSILMRGGKLEQSQKLLELSQAAVRDSAELAGTLLAIGNVEQAIGDKYRNIQSYDKVTEIIDRQAPELALKPYQRAFSAYKQTIKNQQALPITQVQAELNYLDLLIDLEDWWQGQIERRLKTWQRYQDFRSIQAGSNFANLLKLKLNQDKTSLIDDIDRRWSSVSPSRESVFARISYSRNLTKIGKTQNVEAVLQTALAESRAIQDRLSESYAWGYLGKYYGQQQELDKAIALTKKALMTVKEEGVNREISYLWYSQLGQLLEEQGKSADAISAYTSAFGALQSLRTDLNANNQVVQFDFRQEVKPVYLRLANLLLQSDRSQSLGSLELIAAVDRPNTNLELARQVIESLQLAELDNFFQDPCSEAADETLSIDQIDSQAAVVYPIVFGDRVEIILSLPDRPLQRFTSLVSETRVNQAIDLLYDSLYNPGVNDSAVNIFNTTVIDPQEVEENMQTLLPILQQIHSWLIKPLSPALSENKIETLVFVLNGRLQNVPIAALYDGQQYLIEQYGVALAPSLQLLDPEPVARQEIKVLAAGLSEQVVIQDNIFPALPNVPQELAQIEQIFPKSRQLLNQDFTYKNIKEQLASGFSVVHLATHGLFSSNLEETFIVTGDSQAIDIDTLSSLLNSGSSSPDLVVLSACETAAGDERAILGLAGVAVRSGTSSTIASLWSVDDASTTQLMSQFYQEFKNPATKKVDALRKAQLTLMDSLQEKPPAAALTDMPAHPYYWSPYVLVGNWQ
ncbi:MAG: CHAT domain-containing protein [Cyanobacteria bacterium P01_G01_bin.19]